MTKYVNDRVMGAIINPQVTLKTALLLFIKIMIASYDEAELLHKVCPLYLSSLTISKISPAFHMCAVEVL